MKRLLIILLFIPCLAFSQTDRDKHMLVSAGLNIGITELTFQLTKRQGLSIGVGALSTFAIGYFKERVYDKEMGKGTYSNTDLADNGWGIVTSSLVMVVRFDLYNKKQEELKTW